MLIFETEVIGITERAPGVKSFRFKVPEAGVEFKPGQFFFVGIRIDGQERTKHFSFSNSPTEKGFIEFTKRISQSDYSKALDKLKPGDWARIKMPYGSFTPFLQAETGQAFEGEYKKIAFLSGGIGITPIRSICKYAADKALSTDIVLLYGNNTERDIIFREDLDNMCKVNKSMRAAYTLTSPEAAGLGWKGNIGYVDDKMIKEHVPDYSERVFYICGPPAMVTALKDILKASLDLPEEKIRIENFTGY